LRSSQAAFAYVETAHDLLELREREPALRRVVDAAQPLGEALGRGGGEGGHGERGHLVCARWWIAAAESAELERVLPVVVGVPNQSKLVP
jgi:hypothetical protein